jgi:hypothetical protein
VGRPEGESKSYYARVVEGNASGVFIIAEADAQRIVRRLGAFNSRAAQTPASTP